jgi:hypothetical protein
MRSCEVLVCHNSVKYQVSSSLHSKVSNQAYHVHYLHRNWSTPEFTPFIVDFLLKWPERHTPHNNTNGNAKDDNLVQSGNIDVVNMHCLLGFGITRIKKNRLQKVTKIGMQ